MNELEKFKDILSLDPVILKGEFKTKRIWLNGKEMSPEGSTKIYNHRSQGFNWGDCDDGSSQLALTVMWEITKDKRLSVILHHLFKADFIADLRKSDFEISIDIGNWLKKNIGNGTVFD